MTEHFFAPCPRGLEHVLEDELVRLNAESPCAVEGGVHFEGAFELCFVANLESRVASRILWRVTHAARSQ